MSMKNLIFTSLVASILLSIASCKTKKTVVQNDPPANKQELASQHGKGQRPNRQRRTPAQMLTQLDANKDGRLAPSEVKGPLKNRFNSIDTNKNGFLSLKELRAAPRPSRRGPRNGRPNQQR